MPPSPHPPPADFNVDNSTRKGYSGCTHHLPKHWLITLGHPMRNKANFDLETPYPQADTLPQATN
eukprot:1140817-Pelagomonas_calceolata.AAC.2